MEDLIANLLAVLELNFLSLVLGLLLPDPGLLWEQFCLPSCWNMTGPTRYVVHSSYIVSSGHRRKPQTWVFFFMWFAVMAIHGKVKCQYF